jgi:hypothetical protein
MVLFLDMSTQEGGEKFELVTFASLGVILHEEALVLVVIDG